MAYHSDEIPPDIGFNLTGLLPMHVLYSNFCPFLTQFSKKKHAHFDVMNIASKDVNVRGTATQEIDPG